MEIRQTLLGASDFEANETDRVQIRNGLVSEREALEQLQLRASTASPEYREAILRHPDAIELPPEFLADGRVRIAEREGAIVGFCVTLAPAAGLAELEGLFVEPSQWRRGAGRALVLDALDRARAENARAVEVTANPLAVEFYATCGFAEIGEAPTRFGPARRMRYVVGDAEPVTKR